MSSSQRQSRQEITQSSSSSSPPPAPRSHSTTSPASSPRPSQKSPPRQQQQQQRQEGARGEESVGAAAQSPTAATTSGRARDRSSISTRGVYWSDETNPSQFTFYREGTPTPPEYAGDEEKNAGGEGRPTAASAAAAALATARSIEPKEPRPPKKTICGMKRWPFWLLVAFVLVAIGVGVGVGVGIGVVRHRSRMSGTGSSGVTTVPSTSTIPPASSTATSTASASSSTDCPSGNNTVYEVPRSDKRFLRLCGVDYSGTLGAVDLSHVPTSSFADCMNNCAGTVGCTGCSWGPIKGDNGDEHRCWLKSTLQGSHKVTSTWSFGILQ